jgi:mannose-1-phosphate guanylyltransferase/mannose-6-phosphate isomerase
MKINPIILSGGSGTRLWPLSRALHPKQFLDFFGKNSLFQQAILRPKADSDFLNPVIICNNEHRFLAAEELQKIGIRAQSIILEPSGRNTAPAIAVSAFDVVARNPNDDLMLVMPSDHIVKEEKRFIEAVKKATKIAKEGYLVTFGILPDGAETGYGYIKKSEALDEAKEIFAVEKFVEKPEKFLAEEFVKSKEYFWNSGIFLFSASVYLDLLKKINPEIFINCQKSYQDSTRDLDFIRLEKESFEKCQNISIDYAIMEKAKKVAIMPVDIAWSDVGSWEAVAKLSKKDEQKNSFMGDVEAFDVENCYIYSQEKMVAAMGVKDLIIVALKDVVLVANRNKSQEVKKLFEILKEKRREECSSHARVLRPWGSFETIDLGERFKVKRIIVNPQASLSLQVHAKRSEHWVVVKGEAVVVCNEKEFTLNEDQSTYIPLGCKHRLINKTDKQLEIIEVQTGSYLGEDDIVRFNDSYGRS